MKMYNIQIVFTKTKLLNVILSSFIILCCLYASPLSSDDKTDGTISSVSSLPFTRPYVVPIEALEQNNNDLVEMFNSGKLIKSYIKSECYPIKCLKYENDIIIFCVAKWAGNLLDIWVVFYDNITESFSKPFYSGIALQDLLDKQYHSQLYKSVMLKSIDWHIEKDLITINTGYLVVSNKKDYKRTVTMDIKAITSDQDNDGLSYYLERRFGTSPVNEDTDDDGINDIDDSNPSYPINNDSEICIIYNLILKMTIYDRNDEPSFYTVKYKDETNCSIDIDNIVILKRREKIYYSIPEIIFNKPRKINDSEIWITVESKYGQKAKTKTIYRVIKSDDDWEIIDKRILEEVE